MHPKKCDPCLVRGSLEQHTSAAYIHEPLWLSFYEYHILQSCSMHASKVVNQRLSNSIIIIVAS